VHSQRPDDAARSDIRWRQRSTKIGVAARAGLLIQQVHIAQNLDKIGDSPVDTEQRLEMKPERLYLPEDQFIREGCNPGNEWSGRRRYDVNPSLVTRKPSSNCVTPSLSQIRSKKAIPQAVA
jgi:hypothetical protein